MSSEGLKLSARKVPRMTSITQAQVRKLCLEGADLLRSPGEKTTVAEVIRHLGYVQLDSINVLERAHHLILGARIDSYQPQALKETFEVERQLFEQWTHDACLIPVESRPYWWVRHQRFRSSTWGSRWWNGRMAPRPEELCQKLLARIEEEGPLPTRAFRESESKRGAWWGWTPAKTALEFCWRTGTLDTHSRQGFEKVYDLPERIYPTYETLPTLEETKAWCCREAIQRLGVATTSEIAKFWDFFVAKDLQDWCSSNLDSADVGGKTMWIRSDWGEVLQSAPKPGRRLRLLSPFDPLLRDRDRLSRFFDFQYRFEAFVPKAKRRHGYYVCPLLQGEKVVGRVDCKLERKAGFLRVLGTWWEPGGRPQTKALGAELKRLAKRLGTGEVRFDAP